MKNFFVSILGIATLGFLGYIILRHNKSEEFYQNNNGITTYGVVTEHNLSYIELSYIENGLIETYRVKSPNTDIVLGERFVVKYDPEGNHNVQIDFTSPVLDSTLETASTCTEYINPGGNVRYKYSVNGKVYSRSQVVEDTYEFIESASYRVVYYKDKPEIGFIMKETCQ